MGEKKHKENKTKNDHNVIAVSGKIAFILQNTKYYLIRYGMK